MVRWSFTVNAETVQNFSQLSSVVQQCIRNSAAGTEARGKACMEREGTNAGFVGNNLPTKNELDVLFRICWKQVMPGFDQNVGSCISDGGQNYISNGGQNVQVKTSALSF